MKINYTLNENNVIIHWHSFPFDENEPYIDVEEDKIHVKYSQVVNGEFIENKEAYENSIKVKELINSYREELRSIKIWFSGNDWKVNKIIVGEWTTEDPRWLEYLKERDVKRKRQDELNALIKGE